MNRCRLGVPAVHRRLDVLIERDAYLLQRLLAVAHGGDLAQVRAGVLAVKMQEEEILRLEVRVRGQDRLRSGPRCHGRCVNGGRSASTA